MTWFRRATSLFRHLFRKEKVEAELDSELQACLAMLVDRPRVSRPKRRCGPRIWNSKEWSK